MKIIDNSTGFDRKNVVILGTFDGLHRAHMEVIGRGIAIAEEKNLGTVVYTFSNLPASLFGGEDRLIFSKEEKIEAFEALGIDYLCINEFTYEIAATDPVDFLDYVRDTLNAEVIVSGFNFTFGDRARGTTAVIEEYAERNSLLYEKIDCIVDENLPVSSTRIRAEIRKGNMEGAELLLGHPFYYIGTVVTGNRIGRTIGFPTVNINVPSEKITPPYGVYATEVVYDGKTYMGVTNIGVKPTVSGNNTTNIETNIMDEGFDMDLYGKKIQVNIRRFQRPERKFSDFDALKRQIGNDKKNALLYFRKTLR